MTTCQNCGAQLKAKAKFCNVCGTRIAAKEPEITTTPHVNISGAAQTRAASFETFSSESASKPVHRDAARSEETWTLARKVPVCLVACLAFAALLLPWIDMPGFRVLGVVDSWLDNGLLSMLPKVSSAASSLFQNFLSSHGVNASIAENPIPLYLSNDFFQMMTSVTSNNAASMLYAFGVFCVVIACGSLVTAVISLFASKTERQKIPNAIINAGVDTFAIGLIWLFLLNRFNIGIAASISKSIGADCSSLVFIQAAPAVYIAITAGLVLLIMGLAAKYEARTH